MNRGAFFFFFILVYSLCEAKPIHEKHAVTIGNIKQWITLDGDDDRHPPLLFLHGGPGGSAMKFAGVFCSELQKHFVVVQWDQRETGETKALNSSDVALTVALFESDAVELIRHLIDTLHAPRVYLVGHSWGGFLALQVAAHHPELLTACLAASPMIQQTESEKIALVKMKEIAGRDGNREAANDLSQVKIPFENGTQLYYQRKWMFKLINNQKFPVGKKYVEDWAVTWLPMFNDACAVDCFTEIPAIDCPVYFLVGRKDFQTNFSITEKYFLGLKAEKKALFWFEDSAHGLNTSEPKKFQEVIIQIRNQQ